MFKKIIFVLNDEQRFVIRKHEKLEVIMIGTLAINGEEIMSIPIGEISKQNNISAILFSEVMDEFTTVQLKAVGYVMENFECMMKALI